MHVALQPQFLQGPTAALSIHYLVCSLENVQVLIFSGFYFSQECQTIPGGNKNNLQLVLVKSLIGGLPPIFYAFGF